MNTTASVLAVFAAGATLAAQAPPLFPITSLTSPPSIDPRFGPTTISTNATLVAVTQVGQIEMRPVGNTGVYTVTCSVLLAGSGTNFSLLTGTLDLGVSPAVWTPSADVDALNVPNPTSTVPFNSYQLSMSPDQLVVVWDNYVGTSSGALWPNAPPVPTKAHTFVCARPNTGVPFASTNAWPVVGFTHIWSDPHIGPLVPLTNGRYEFFFSDKASGGYGSIVRAEIDPASGLVFPPAGATAPVTLRPKTHGTVYAHSPFVMRDSSGKVRALSFGQTMDTTSSPPSSLSSMFWAPNVIGAGNPYLLADGFTYPAPPIGPGWFSNGSANGGTLVYGLADVSTWTQVHPQIVEHTLLADTDLIASEPIAAWAPIRPLGPAPVPPSFVSVVVIGTGLLPTPVTLPPLLGNVWLNPTALLFLGPMSHDPYTGYAQFPPPPGSPFNVSLPMQSVTFGGGGIYVGNVAQLRL